MDVPIRNGNRPAPGVDGRPPEVLDVPIRNGNDPLSEGSRTVSKVLDVPIRNGNVSDEFTFIDLEGGFGRTYKEWKLS